MSSEILPVLQSIAYVVSGAIFLFAAFRAVTIGRALVKRVYRTRAYVTGIFSIFLAVVSLVAVVSVYWSAYAYPFELVFIFVFLDSTILVSLDTDFFHRNTLRWRQVRFVGYSAMALICVVNGLGDFLPTYYKSLFYVQVSPAQFTPLGEIVSAVEVASIIFVFIYVFSTALVSARRSSDMPLRRFLEYTGILLFLYLVNTLIAGLVTRAIAPFFFVIFAYVMYRMAMSLSPVGRVKKEAV